MSVSRFPALTSASMTAASRGSMRPVPSTRTRTLLPIQLMSVWCTVSHATSITMPRGHRSKSEPLALLSHASVM